nr:Gp138 family membrane-puncturing spike protein [uncultured Enterobacter sp.]
MALSATVQEAGEPQAFESLRKKIFSTLRVALPGIIHSFDPVTVTCSVTPAIAGEVQNEKGEWVVSTLPLLVDVPVVFPRGGGGTLTFPVRVGDECLVIFADRCIDFWWQSGGVQQAQDPRTHDLSDAFALMGPQSQAQKISAISTQAVQLRSDDGSTFFELNPTTQKIKIVAPGGMEIVAPQASITGATAFSGSVSANGKRIDDTHTHGGIQRGSANTNGVN